MLLPIERRKDGGSKMRAARAAGDDAWADETMAGRTWFEEKGFVTRDLAFAQQDHQRRRGRIVCVQKKSSGSDFGRGPEEGRFAAPVMSWGCKVNGSSGVFRDWCGGGSWATEHGTSENDYAHSEPQIPTLGCEPPCQPGSSPDHVRTSHMWGCLVNTNRGPPTKQSSGAP